MLLKRPDSQYYVNSEDTNTSLLHVHMLRTTALRILLVIGF